MWRCLLTLFSTAVPVETPDKPVVLNESLFRLLPLIKIRLTYESPGIFPMVLLTNKEREVETCKLIWLFNELIFVVSIDREKTFKDNNLDLQKDILSASLIKQPWWFNKQMFCYISILNQALTWSNDTKVLDINIPYVPKEDFYFEGQKLVYRKISIKSQDIIEELVCCCITGMTHGIPLVNNMNNTIIEDCMIPINNILENHSLNRKSFALVFILRSLSSLEAFETSYFLNAVENINNIYIQLPLWLKFGDEVKQRHIDKFNKIVCKFFTDIPVTKLNLKCQHDVKKLVNIAIQIINFQLRNCNESFFDGKVTQVLVKFIKNVLNSYHYAVESVSSISLLLEFIEFAEVISLLEFLIISEIELSKFESDLLKNSSTWLEVHKSLCEKVKNLSNAKTTDNFYHQLTVISELFLLPIKIEYGFTKRHQLLHLKCAEECFCHNLTILDCNDIHMKFNNWDYKHLQLKFYEDIETLIKQLIDVISNRNDIDLEMMVAFIVTSSHILKSSVTSNLSQKSIFMLMSVVVSPFYKPLKESPSNTNSAGYIKIVNILPQNLKIFYDRKDLKPESLLQMQIVSTTTLSQLSMNRLNPICLYLSLNIINFITKQKEIDLKRNLIKRFPNFLVCNLDNFSHFQQIYQRLVNELSTTPLSSVICILNQVLCLSDHNAIIIKTPDATPNIYSYRIICNLCVSCYTKHSEDDSLRQQALLKQNNGILISTDHFAKNIVKLHIDPSCLLIDDIEFKSCLIEHIPAIIVHTMNVKKMLIEDGGKRLWQSLLGPNNLSVLDLINYVLKDIFATVYQQDFTDESRKLIMEACRVEILDLMKKNLKASKEVQSVTVQIIFNFATTVKDEETLVKCIRMLLYYILTSTSTASSEATLCAIELCQINGITIEQLFNWHRSGLIKLVVNMSFINYLREGRTLIWSLHNFIKSFKFGKIKEFLTKYYPTFFAVILPLCIKSNKYFDVLEEINESIQQDMADSLMGSFMTVYQAVFDDQDTETREACFKYIVEKTGSSITDLMKTNKTQNVTEILMHYHKSPEFAMHALQHYLKEDRMDTNMEAEEVAHFISRRFLGVLNNFEMVLIDLDCEKSVKRDTLLSLGGIIRLLGTNLITPFSFKIMAVLKTAYAVTLHSNLDMSEICLEIWKIFICTADISSLGSVLSKIFVALEPYLENYPKQVNEIYRYLVVENENLLSCYIPDLFFIDKTSADINVKTAIKKRIRSQKLNDGFFDNFKMFMKHLSHENADGGVRIYGLMFLSELCQSNRRELNNLIIGKVCMNPIVEELLQTLINNCKSNNRMLQLCAAECLGEVGAIEPGLQAPNYSPQRPFSSTIRSVSFACMALTELCRSYQYQNDSKCVDGLSLAIQEILKAQKVDVQKRINMKVWEAIPERMRPLMEPLLTSAYTPLNFNINKNSPQHPVFGTTSDWAYVWSSVLIERISDENTKHLLGCIRPSMRNNNHNASLFLPYVLLHSIEKSEVDQHELIKEEFEFVFQFLLNDNQNEKHQNEKKYLKQFEFIPTESGCENVDGTGKIELGIQCAKMIFDLFDFLENWIRTRTTRTLLLYAQIQGILNHFDKKMLATVNFKCREYARALIYLEEYIKENKKERLQEELSLLAKIYAELEDPDSVEGVRCVKTTELTLSEQILINNVTGSLHESATCFERLIQIGEFSAEHFNDLVGCYVGLDQPETALLVGESILKKLYDDNAYKMFNEIKAEPLWRLGRFEELEQLLDNPEFNEVTDWGVRCGQLLIKFRHEDHDEFVNELKTTRLAVIKMLRASETLSSAYKKSYPEVIKLHLINEFEKAEKSVYQIRIDKDLKKAVKNVELLIDDWNMRMDFIQPTPAIVEPIHCLRRIILNETRIQLGEIFREKSKPIDQLIEHEIANLWIKSTKYACKKKMFQQAHLYILNAEQYKPKELFLEKAKFFWEKGDQINAFKVLDLGIKGLVSDNDDIDKLTLVEKHLYSRGKLMQACYNAEAVNVDFDANRKYFLESIRSFKDEKNYLLYSEFLDKKFLPNEDNNNHVKPDYQKVLEIMENYARSMLQGCNYVFQSMPRFLSIWFDSTAVLKDNRSSENQKIFEKMNQAAGTLLNKLPPYFFFTAFSQLVSRICHPCPEVFSVLKDIISMLIITYPHQSLWFLASILKSSYPNRVKRCKEILMDPRLSSDVTQKLVKDFYSLVDKFVVLTSGPNDKTKFKVREVVPDLPKLLQNNNVSKFLMPLQRNLQLVRDCKSFTFPDEIVYIHGIDEEVEQLRSLQKPRKVKLIGSDGKQYTMLFKFKDDLRKDFRFMEFAAVVKDFLHKDPEARHRRLNVRTYSVIPLNEEAGIIEWVPNLRTFKDIVMSQYQKAVWQTPSLNDLKNMNIEKQTLVKRRETYKTLLLKHYPVFGDWFREQFPNPHNYFQARTSFIKTSATMSIIGYIMGLGDRHGENILFDSCTGDTVHVDFNCLFNKGEELPIPELVPFRLTNNMVEAMGPLSTEGLYRKCCEITLRVLQKEKNTLMSYLRPFVYDPLMSWERANVRENREIERTDPKALTNIRNIEQRIKGVVKKYKGSSGIPLSTEGQVNFIIEEATNIDNLCSMFFGWSSFM
ncbi:unnamed protein product [Diamesa hyperborea]